MIRQQVGDVLEINFENRWYYVVILTKIVMFGGNIVFAYHNDGKKMTFEQLNKMREGFNICTDLIGMKRKGLVTRIGKIKDVDGLFISKYAKHTLEHRKGVKATRWSISDIHDYRHRIAVVSVLPDIYRNAMDIGTFGFGSVADKILERYTPDQNEHI